MWLARDDGQTTRTLLRGRAPAGTGAGLVGSAPLAGLRATGHERYKVGGG